MKAQFSRSENGFTLIELMITIAIIGILAAIAIPSYMSYTLKAQFSEVVQAADAQRAGVGICAQKNNSLATCSNGAEGIPVAQTAAGNVASVTTAAGVITATSQNLSTNYTYILTPTLQTNGVVTWTVGGTCVAAGVCS